MWTDDQIMNKIFSHKMIGHHGHILYSIAMYTYEDKN